ncbi:subtilisin family serine protease [Prauserella sediminis]|uniref:Subtilisin family serine protease n=1 Tax=Prauserella sediminis TaxID=577680 RepID=A0A839XIA7_9PSEU|nr:S8 family serine peptidase [Prauserella sediminis]MBB3661489.1 subtilisin family serine protease [Prauserella sediminis]
MNRWRARLLAICSTVLLAVTFAAGGASAQDAARIEPLPTASADDLDPGRADGGISPPLAESQGRTAAFVEVKKRSAVDAFNDEKGKGTNAAAKAAKRARSAALGAVDTVVGNLRASDGSTTVLARTANAIAGAVVAADAERLRELAGRDDVVSVKPIVPKKHQNAGADQLTKAINVWQQTGHYGEGVKVGVIDSGIDYTHATFGGPGTKDAYESVDPTKEAPELFPSAKVAGGTDLVGDDYDASGENGSETPKPDPNPLPCMDHGTHVAGTAAGYGVEADGSTFSGDYSKLDGDALMDMKVAPGSAPKAELYDIKVFGCAGSTAVMAEAMDWTLDPNGDGDFSDKLDVVNMSVGSDYGAPDDPEADFVRKLVANDVLPVMSAGNGGDLYDIGGSPGNTPEGLGVASIRDSYVLRDAVEVAAPSDVAGKVAGQFSLHYADYDSLDITKPVVALSGDNADGCAEFSESDAAAVKDKIAWLEWDDNDETRQCGSGARADHATAAGAAGVVFTSGVQNFGAAIAGNEDVPVFQLTGEATENLRPALDAGTLEVTMTGDGRTSLPTEDESIEDTPSSFTSRGVRGPAVKPDLASPGDTIASALMGGGDAATVMSGTSMASPHAAGITALVWEANPDWNATEVKNSVMNTAAHEVTSEGTVVGPQRVGAGRVDARAAIDNDVMAYSLHDRKAVSVSFGVLEVSQPTVKREVVRIVNKGDETKRYSLRYAASSTVPGVSYELSSESVTVPARGSADVAVKLRIDPAAMRKTIDPTLERNQLDVPRQFVAEAAGRMVLEPQGQGATLRLPVHAAPKPVAKLHHSRNIAFRGGSDTADVRVLGRGLDQGSGSEAYRSLMSIMELHARSPKLPPCLGEQTSGCAVNETAEGGDLRHVGATSVGEGDGAMLAFGLSTWGNWSSLGGHTIPYVHTDTDGDGEADYETYAMPMPSTDVLVAQTVRLSDGSTVDLQPVNGQFGDVDTNTFDSNVAVLPVSLGALGIDPSDDSHEISYTVGVSGFYGDPETGDVDRIDEPIAFDPLNPAYTVAGADGAAALSYVAGRGDRFTVTRNPDSADSAEGLLVLNHHNASGRRASAVGIHELDHRPVSTNDG